MFKSAILHFLAILGINKEINWLCQANDFSYMLASIVYCMRVLANVTIGEFGLYGISATPMR